MKYTPHFYIFAAALSVPSPDPYAADNALRESLIIRKIFLFVKMSDNISQYWYDFLQF